MPMNRYDYVEKTLYMAILSQESVEGNSKVASGLWEIIKNLTKNQKHGIFGFMKGAAE